MKSLYPPIEPARVYQLNVDSPHCIYVEECGNPNGIPVIFLHGGPGSGSKPYHRQFFNPEHYRIIVFDQRGTGRSTPLGEIRNNTTQALIEDMERIRNELGIDRWVLFGGSWGVALALAYAEAHPQNVSGIILRGVFLGSQAEIDWMFREGVNRIFPDAWEQFQSHVSPADTDLVEAYHRQILSDNYQQQQAAAKNWMAWTGRVVTWLLPASEDTSAFSEPTPEVLESMLHSARIECHYTANRYFLQKDQLLQNIASIPAMPVIIIHGRRDLTCTLDAAWTLHKALPESKLVILPDSGHLASEPAMIDALVTATDDIHGELS